MIAAWLLGSSFSAQAMDIYVHNQIGSDANRGVSAVVRGVGDGPVRTIAAALRRVPRGGRIVVLPSPVPYRESIHINGTVNQGYQDSPLIIEGNGVELLGDRPIEHTEWNYVRSGTFRLSRPDATTGVLFLGGKRVPFDPSVNAGQLNPSPESYAIFRGSYYFNLPAGKGIRDYPLSESLLDSGVFIHRASHVVVRNFRIRGFSLDAVQVRGPVEGIRIQNCLLADSGRAGVSGYTLSDVELENCFLENNTKIGALAENTSTLYLKSCLVTGSPQELVFSQRSDIRKSGGDPEPLQSGPFLVPPGFRVETPVDSRVEDEPAEKPREEEPPAPVQKKSFFDE